jgi:hypothetical protein
MTTAARIVVSLPSKGICERAGESGGPEVTAFIHGPGRTARKEKTVRAAKEEINKSTTLFAWTDFVT